MTLSQIHLPPPQWPRPAQSPRVTHEAQILHHRHHQEPHAPNVSGHSLSPVKSLPTNKCCRTLNSLSSAELFSSLLPLPLAAVAVLVQVSDTHNPGLTRSASGSPHHPGLPQDLWDSPWELELPTSLRQAVQRCAGSTIGSAGRALPPFVQPCLCCRLSARPRACEGQPLREYPGDKFHV